MARRQVAFLTAFARFGLVTRAAQAAGIHRTTHNNWLKQSSYRERFHDATKDFVDRIEARALHLAIDGQIRKKFYKGRPIIDPVTGKQYFEVEYDATMLMFLLNRHHPDYRAQSFGEDARYGFANRAITVRDVVNLLKHFQKTRPRTDCPHGGKKSSGTDAQCHLLIESTTRPAQKGK